MFVDNFELVNQCKSFLFDDDFAKLVKHYIPVLRQSLNNVLHKDILVYLEKEEIEQEVWIRVYKNICKLKNIYTFKSWLNKITKQCVNEKLRKYIRRQKFTSNFSLDTQVNGDSESTYIELVPDKCKIEQSLITEAFYKQFNQAMSTVPGQYRQVLVLFIFKQKSYYEIADELKISLGTVKSRLSRARALILTQLADFL